MRNLKTKRLIFMSFIAFLALTLCTYSFFVSSIYNDFSVVKGENYSLKGIFGTRLFAYERNTPVSNNFTSDLLREKGRSGYENQGAVYEKQIVDVDAKLFGVIPLKSFQISVYPDLKLIPSGQAVGVKMFTDGVMIVGMNDFKTSEGNKNPAYLAGLRTGDIILEINGVKQKSIEQVSEFLAGNGEKNVNFKIRREGAEKIFEVAPLRSLEDGKYKAGIWIRDSTAGIGTVTFVEEKTGLFASLGHGVCDTDTGEMMPISNGSIHKTSVTGVKKGEKGSPGELRSSPLDIEKNPIGKIYLNKKTGIYGIAGDEFKKDLPFPAISPGFKETVKEEEAEILSTIDGESPQAFKVEIIKIYKDDGNDGRNMLLKIKDERLLSKTGGIVQGMSGSPIIQNGRLIGAVTHVLVNDPTKGYGIFIENMLSDVFSEGKVINLPLGIFL